MSEIDEQKQSLKARRYWRVFALLFSLSLLLVPFMAFVFQNLASQDQIVQVSEGSVDAQMKHNLGTVARYVRGEIEFYYNDWLYTEGEDEAPDKSYLPTPGYWTGKNGGLNSAGYASYRYVIHNLEPGSELKVYPIIDIPNRVYLNGNLCSEVGYPSRYPQSPFVDLSHEISHSYVVPSDGVVEYVMEVGNTGNGGSRRIGIIYMESTFIESLSTLPFATVAVGTIIGILIFLGIGFWFSLHRATMFAFSLLGTGTLLFFLLSIDSPFVGAGLFYGGTTFLLLSVICFAAMVASVLFFERISRKKVLFFGELIAIFAVILISTTLCCVSVGTDIAIYFYALLAACPIYLFVRHLVRFLQGRQGIKLATIYACLGSIGLVSSLSMSNVTFISYSAFPSALSLILCLIGLAAAFHEIYFDSLRQKDEAIFTRRYHQISSRALSRASNASDAVATLDYIGAGYDKSLRTGDKRLLTFSTITRRRLLALREERIGLEEECELEGQLFDMRQAVYGGKGTLILDVENSTKRIPPLLFESAIDSLSKQLKDDEVIVLSEGKRSVSLTFPKRLRLDYKVLSAIQERIELVGLGVRVVAGGIIISRRERR